MTVDLFFQRIEDDNRRQPGRMRQAALTDPGFLWRGHGVDGPRLADGLLPFHRFRLRLDKFRAGPIAVSRP
jgi:hypothetical protein